MNFNSNVFINCPFDNEYRPLLRSLIFCLLYLDYNPILSKTKSSANIRVNEIKKLIEKSKFGIHDLSRCKPMKKDDNPRFNMPFELGLDIGCLAYGNSKRKTKKILILETDRYFYQKIISDIGGQDIASHKDNPEELIIKVRNFFAENTNRQMIKPSSIWYAYNEFLDDLEIKLKNKNYTKRDIEGMLNSDFIKFCKPWLRKYKG